MSFLKDRLSQILTPEICLSVYNLRFPFPKQSLTSGAVVGQAQFGNSRNIQAFYDLIYHAAVTPLSRIPLDELLSFDLTTLLPPPTAEEYPEHCLGMIQILDQSRTLMHGYGLRYTRSFFDPLCEKLVRQLIAMPDDIRPDGKQAWLSRGYSFDDWLIRVLWFWAPLVHSDRFMVNDRSQLKEWLHYMRAEIESHYSIHDPFASVEAQDDIDVTLFNSIIKQGPPLKSHSDPEAEALIADYGFWWIRILNAHFAITDMCGHYPYKVRWQGLEWTDKDREYMEKTNWFFHDPVHEPVLAQVRKDYLDGTWQPLEPNPKFERSQ